LGREIFTKEGIKNGKAFAHICNEEVATPWHGNHENNSVLWCQSLIGG